ncbi:MAG: hypothetical protein J5508_00175, partial [Bacteroidales bacterium]|nr:hypothetical protein [Bacteroidales bacterium]
PKALLPQPCGSGATVMNDKGKFINFTRIWVSSKNISGKVKKGLGKRPDTGRLAQKGYIVRRNGRRNGWWEVIGERKTRNE